MALAREFTNCILQPAEITPSQDDLEVVGVFNPGVAVRGEDTVLLVRIAETPLPTKPGWIALPRWDKAAKRIILDWVREDEVVRQDTRSVRFKRNGIVRLTFVSHLCVAWSRDGRTIDRFGARRFGPAGELEEYGVEDPRITKIDDLFQITYVGVSRHGPATLLATTEDFETFDRCGVIFCPDNKDVVLFPRKIGGSYFALHRPSLSSDLSRPEMWIAASPDLQHWGEHQPLLGGTREWETGRVGAGAPPVATAAGWLEFYHGNDRRYGDERTGRYSGGLLLLESERPWQIRGFSDAVMVPELSFETSGFAPNVVFPTGIVERDDLLFVYYGAADTVTAVTAYKRRNLLAAVGVA